MQVFGFWQDVLPADEVHILPVCGLLLQALPDGRLEGRPQGCMQAAQAAGQLGRCLSLLTA